MLSLRAYLYRTPDPRASIGPRFSPVLEFQIRNISGFKTPLRPKNENWFQLVQPKPSAVLGWRLVLPLPGKVCCIYETPAEASTLTLRVFWLPMRRPYLYREAVKREISREVQVFKSFAEAEEADYAYYRSLTGNEKLELMLEIMAPAYEAAPRFERVYRVVEKTAG